MIIHPQRKLYLMTNKYSMKKKSKIKIKKVMKRPHAKIVKVSDNRYAVYFDFMKIPIHMELPYLSSLLSKKQIIIKSVISARERQKMNIAS